MALRNGPGFPGALNQEIDAMFVEAATRVGFAYAVSLAAFVVLVHVLA